MKISNNKLSIEAAILKAQEEAKEQEIEQRAEALVSHIENKFINKPLQSKWPCSALVWELLGANAHMATDEAEEMKQTTIDLLTFLADPEIVERFAKVRKSYLSRNYPDHLRRLIKFFDDANMKESLAEMAHYELSAYGHSEQQLDRLEGDYYERIK